ncbi:hypothetical protein ACQP1K_14505 [Sphaerimonospora sp. CA-214678]|uniref:hypothetical protein n=1 Tax=Sphaerimonospora sp. CA-214678 TaxID=3240029 RepID=UPI003D93B2B5
MRKVLITVRLPHGASLESARRHLDLAEDEVDAGYGLIPVDPAHDLYAMRVTEAASHRVAGSHPEASGPYADPPISPIDRGEPYGRPE